MVLLRSLLFNLLFYVALVVVMVLASPALLFGHDAVRAAARLWGRSSLVLLRLVCGIRVEFRGLENIPEGGCIVASKHQSFMEVFTLILAFTHFTYVLKRELTWIPLFGWYLVRSGQIAINRSKGRAALGLIVRRARQVLGGQGQLFIFPEGTRRPAGAPPAYKYGVALLYQDLGVPCVPVALNTGLFWPRRSVLRRPGTVVFEILPPIPAGLPAAAFLPRLQEAIETATDRLTAEAVARDPSLGEVIRRGAAMADTPAA